MTLRRMALGTTALVALLGLSGFAQAADVTIMVGGASWPGTSSGAPLYIDDVSVMAP